jgi:uncharacterized membrane protein YeaQ/YmgE (transglycosylase-associated protein family)
MSFIVYLIALLFSGLVVGAFARLALPGPDPMSIPQTIAIGIAGSFVGGLLAGVLFGRGAGLVLSIACASGIVYMIRRSRGGGLTNSGGRRSLP